MKVAAGITPPGKNGHPANTMNYFSYDALLRRFAVQESSGVSYFTWDQNGMNLLAERDASGSVTAYYTHGYSPVDGIGSLVAAKHNEASTSYYQYPVYDHRGSVVRLLDENGTPTAYFEYDAWGNQLESNVVGGTGTNRFRYQSNWIELKDSGGDLYLSPTRIYHAATGRFLGRDPLGSLAGDYSYGWQSPAHFVDSRGLLCECLCGPDVTKPLKSVVRAIRLAFQRWSKAKKANHCRTLLDWRTARSAWDVAELYAGHYDLYYTNRRNSFGGKDPTPGLDCPQSVVVEEPPGKYRCWYVGSVNYVTWGVMMSLCDEADVGLLRSKTSIEAALGEFGRGMKNQRAIARAVTGGGAFSIQAMLDYIDFYKGRSLWGITLRAMPSNNWMESRQWATAGYRGWPHFRPTLDSPNLREAGSRKNPWKPASAENPVRGAGYCQVLGGGKHPKYNKRFRFGWMFTVPASTTEAVVTALVGLPGLAYSKAKTVDVRKEVIEASPPYNTETQPVGGLRGKRRNWPKRGLAGD